MIQWEDGHMKVGFIGLGIMGKPMAHNVLKHGHDLIVASRNPDTNKEMANSGAHVVDSIGTVASECNVMILMLPNSPEVEDVILGEKGLIHHLKPGSTIVDMSSIAPNVSKKMYNALKEYGVSYLDAPVSGGEPKAIDGTISVMVGGDQDVYDTYLPLLQTMAGDVTRVGEAGAGNATKLVNQIIVALNIAAVSEGLVMAEKMGVDTELVYQAIRGGLAGSTVLDSKVPSILDGKFEPGFKLALHMKDLNNVKETLDELDLDLPLTESVREIIENLVQSGHGEEDHGAIVKKYEQNAGVDVRK